MTQEASDLVAFVQRERAGKGDAEFVHRGGDRDGALDRVAKARILPVLHALVPAHVRLNVAI